MILITIVVETIINGLLLIRNAVIRLRPAPEFVVVTVRGPLPERRPAPPGRLRRWLGRAWVTPPPESLEEWRERLRLLAGDRRVRGIVVKLGDLHAGLASLEGLRRALQSFRASGKRLIAYLATCDLPGYYLISAADTVVAPESAELALHGLRSETTFLRAALDRVGIRAQFSHIAEYKTATHRFLYPKMTPPQREMVDAVLGTTFAHLIAVVAEGRGLAETSVEEAIASYRAAHYCIEPAGASAVILRIGERSGGLAALYSELGVDSCAFLTASNPLADSPSTSISGCARSISRITAMSDSPSVAAGTGALKRSVAARASSISFDRCGG